ncbi:unnamed protein product [Amoebophrya sp. A25]|nr:unnamed protein product [Amoebophrya sp. A25]|eukprot:GSA25T00000788001.1
MSQHPRAISGNARFPPDRGPQIRHGRNNVDGRDITIENFLSANAVIGVALVLFLSWAFAGCAGGASSDTGGAVFSIWLTPEATFNNGPGGQRSTLKDIAARTTEQFGEGAVNTFPYMTASRARSVGALDAGGPPGRLLLLGDISSATAPHLFSAERTISASQALKNVLQSTVMDVVSNVQPKVMNRRTERGRHPQRGQKDAREYARVQFKEVVALESGAAAVGLILAEVPFVQDQLKQGLLDRLQLNATAREAASLPLLLFSGNENDALDRGSCLSLFAGSSHPWQRKQRARDFVRKEYGPQLLGPEFSLTNAELWVLQDGTWKELDSIALP